MVVGAKVVVVGGTRVAASRLAAAAAGEHLFSPKGCEELPSPFLFLDYKEGKNKTVYSVIKVGRCLQCRGDRSVSWRKFSSRLCVRIEGILFWLKMAASGQPNLSLRFSKRQPLLPPQQRPTA